MCALVYLAREEVFAGTELADSTLENAELEFRKFTSKELETLLKRLREVAKSNSEAFNSLKSVKQVAGALSQSSRSE